MKQFGPGGEVGWMGLEEFGKERECERWEVFGGLSWEMLERVVAVWCRFMRGWLRGDRWHFCWGCKGGGGDGRVCLLAGWKVSCWYTIASMNNQP